MIFSPCLLACGRSRFPGSLPPGSYIDGKAEFHFPDVHQDPTQDIVETGVSNQTQKEEVGELSEQRTGFNG